MIQTLQSNDTTYSSHDKIGDDLLKLGLPSPAGHGMSIPIFGVSFFLRFIGITNAALWFGTAIFFTAFIWPAFDTPEMAKILPASHSGAVAQVVLERYDVLQYLCGAIALSHLLAEWLYAGRALRRWTLCLLAGLLAFSLFNGQMITPRLQRLHLDTYGIRSTPQQREQGRRSARLWNGALRVSNVFVSFGLWVYIWRLNRIESPARFVSAGKFRG